MKKITLMFIAMFLSVPAAAKICMVNDPAILVTHAQLAEINARIAALEDVSTQWLSVWSSAGNPLSNSSNTYVNGQNGTWTVTSNQSGETKTIRGVSMCSSTSGTVYNPGNPSNDNGYNCWCKMTSPRLGAWVFHNSFGSCSGSCANLCSTNLPYNSAYRIAALAPL